MKVILLSTHDLKPGAASAAYRLHRGLIKTGVKSKMMVQTKESTDKSVFPVATYPLIPSSRRVTLDKSILKICSKGSRIPHSPQWVPDRISSTIAREKPDVINLHWVCGGFMQIETLAKLAKPVVWTLHDMWAFTGGCHYAGACSAYERSCGNCPNLGSKIAWDISKLVWKRKADAWRNVDLTVVTPSVWLGNCARNSTLFKDSRVEVIPNGIDTKIFKPIDKNTARHILNLPKERRLILFGAVNATSDKRKGFHLLRSALQKISQQNSDASVELCIFGSDAPGSSREFGFKTHYLGKLKDLTTLAMLYSAVDILVAPSMEENLATTVLEAIACGTPCAVFNIGGMPDLIDHQVNGYLAKPFDVDDLARGITWILENGDEQHSLSLKSREKAEKEFSIDGQVNRYLSLFEKVSEEPASKP